MANGKNGFSKDPTINVSFSIKTSVIDYMDSVCDALELDNKSRFVSDAILAYSSFLASQNPIVRKQYIKKLHELSCE